jgi:hypothetical protein
MPAGRLERQIEHVVVSEEAVVVLKPVAVLK